MRPANEIWRYTVTPSLIGWEHICIYVCVCVFIVNAYALSRVKNTKRKCQVMQYVYVVFVIGELAKLTKWKVIIIIIMGLYDGTGTI